jgi:hypothetical protein
MDSYSQRNSLKIFVAGLLTKAYRIIRMTPPSAKSISMDCTVLYNKKYIFLVKHEYVFR